MAIALKKTYRVANLSTGFNDEIIAQLTEHVEGSEARGSTGFMPLAAAGSLTVLVSEDEAAKFLPGQYFEVSISPVKSA